MKRLSVATRRLVEWHRTDQCAVTVECCCYNLHVTVLYYYVVLQYVVLTVVQLKKFGRAGVAGGHMPKAVEPRRRGT